MNSGVLLSGGMDSAIALYWARVRRGGLTAWSIDYGQKHKRELVAAKAIAKAAGVPHEMTMTNATATYKILNSTTAIITVDYSNGSFGMERVTRPTNGSLYEAAYNAAAVKAAIQGDRLERFSEET